MTTRQDLLGYLIFTGASCFLLGAILMGYIKDSHPGKVTVDVYNRSIMYILTEKESEQVTAYKKQLVKNRQSTNKIKVNNVK